MTSRSDASVLIAGAGPTGLVLAIALARRGVPVRIVSEAAGPGERSRAMVVHARTLEFYRQLGFADEVLAEGIPVERAHLRRGGRDGPAHEILTVDLTELGGNISPYPFVHCYAQDDHERLLIRQLAELGLAVEWGTRLTGFAEADGEIRATLQRSDAGPEEVACANLCGCDGAHSQVRRTLGFGFPGGTYEQPFYVADVKCAGPFNRDFDVNLGGSILTLRLPVRSTGMDRLIGLVPPRLAGRNDLTFEDVRADVEGLTGLSVGDVNWFSVYRVHHRVAASFRSGRAFILGDAGHIHSPAGGQGMNTGIGDAINLGWKLADVLRGRADAAILDSYEAERLPFARSLVATTDRAFTQMVAGGVRGEVTRRFLAPLLMTVATRFELGRHALFRRLSQVQVHYPDSPLSQGQVGRLEAGERLPWAGGAGVDNFAPLRSLDWQVHVYGTRSPDLAEACRELSLTLHAFAWQEGLAETGLTEDAVCLVRPDGYIGAASPADGAPAALRDYACRHGLRLG